MSTAEAQPLSIALPQWTKKVNLVPYVIVGALMVWYLPRVAEHYRAQKYYLAGNLLRTEHRATEALAMYRETILHDPELAEARIYLAANLAQAGQSEEARKHIDTILMKNPSYPMARFILAIANFELGDSIRATKAMTEELQLETSPQTVYYASLLRRKMNQSDSEYAYIKILLTNSVRSGSGEFVKEGLESLADLSHLRGVSGECGELVSNIRRSFSQNLTLLLAVEDFCEATGSLKEAESTLKQAQAIKPDDADVKNRLARLAEAQRAAMKGAGRK